MEMIFSANAATAWVRHLQLVKDFISQKISFLNADFAVYLTINSTVSVDENQSWNGFSNDEDWIAIDDQQTEETSRRIFIKFASIKGKPCISFEFMEGPNDDCNLRFREISEMKFDASILVSARIYIEFVKWIREGKFDTSFFETNQKASCSV